MQQKGVQAGSVGTGGVSFASDAIKRGGGRERERISWRQGHSWI